MSRWNYSLVVCFVVVIDLPSYKYTVHCAQRHAIALAICSPLLCVTKHKMCCSVYCYLNPTRNETQLYFVRRTISRTKTLIPVHIFHFTVAAAVA